MGCLKWNLDSLISDLVLLYGSLLRYLLALSRVAFGMELRNWFTTLLALKAKK